MTVSVVLHRNYVVGFYVGKVVLGGFGNVVFCFHFQWNVCPQVLVLPLFAHGFGRIEKCNSVENVHFL